jgi:hypothetical protein
MFCSLVGDPKTAITIVRHRFFLKFIPVMSNIQRMDVTLRGPEIPVGAGLLAIAVYQSQSMLNVPASSRAGSLPH